MHEIVIRAAIDRVWHALVDPDFTERYYFDSRIELPGLRPTMKYHYIGPEGSVRQRGEVVDADPPHRLVLTLDGQWDPAVAADPPSRLTFELSEITPGVTSLRVTHDGVDGDTATYRQMAGGWPFIASGLKTLLETGAPLMGAEA